MKKASGLTAEYFTFKQRGGKTKHEGKGRGRQGEGHEAGGGGG